MLTAGGRFTGIRVLAVAGAFAVAMLTSAATPSAALASVVPGLAGSLAGTDTGLVHMSSAARAPMHSGPDDVPGMEMDQPDVPGMEMDKPAGAPESGAHEHGAPGSPTQDETSGDMPGMDMSGEGSEPSGGHEHGASTEPVTKKPLVPVLGTFGGGTAAVMLTAAVMRRKDREHLETRRAAPRGRQE
jgi:hypothetical protein